MNRSRTRARMAGCWMLAAAMFGSAVTVDASPSQPNVIYFGNSFTHYYNWPNAIDQAVDAISLAAGRNIGTTLRQSVASASLQTHLDATGTSSIEHLASAYLPVGETWDFVVIQGLSTEATAALGDPATFVDNAEAIYTRLAVYNPDVKAVLYETWARNPHTTEAMYPTPFGNPGEMQAQIRSAYRGVVYELNTLIGPGTARYAGAGDAFESLNFADDFYKSDFYHASDRGGLLASLTIYGAMYGPTTRTLAQSGALDTLAGNANLSHEEIVTLSAAADAAGAKPGDADMDLDVDFNDLLILAQHYQSPDPQSWFTGDFDASNTVDFNDLLALAQHYGNPASFEADWAHAQTLVPEPATLGLCVFMLHRARTRRARHSSAMSIPTMSATGR